MSVYLRQGTILDEKYRIDRVIGHGGFGITYEGTLLEHVRTKVAVKELFLSGYMERDADVSETVTFRKESQRPAFEKIRDDFLKEAIILGILNKEPAVVNVIDRFKANGTAYIVMEFVEGVTLLQYWKEHGNFRDLDIFKRMLPVIDALKKIHDNELIHGDISPENIMVQQDGTLKMIDFGAAGNERNFQGAKAVKDGYAPAEMYCEDGQIGPWTDVYGLCATIYFCLTGKVPETAVQRVLYDELERPSGQGIKMEEGLEEILWKGLSVDQTERYQTMEELETELKKVIPEEKKKLPFPVIAAGTVVLIGVMGTAAVLGYRSYREKNKFNGIETQKVLLLPEEDMTVNNYVEARQVVEERVRVLAGEEPYTIRDNSEGRLEIITPLDLYEDYDVQELYDLMISGTWNTELGKYVESDGTYLRCSMDHEDVLSAVLQTGANLKMTTEQAELIQPEVNKYIYIVLTDEKAKELREAFPTETILKLYLDFQSDETIHDALSVSVSEDGKELYLYGSFLQKARFGELMVYNLTNPSFEQAFRLYCEIAANWESPDDSMLTGEYQCREEEIPDPAVTVSYSQDELSARNLSKGEWAYVLVNLKDRLDQLHIPYAIGSEKDDAGQIVVKIKKEDASAFLLDTVMTKGNDLTVSGKWDDYGLNLSGRKTVMELTNGTDGNYRYSVRLEEGEWDSFQNFTQRLLEAGEQELYLVLGGYYVAQCTIDAPVTDGRILFDRVCDGKDSRITEANRYLFDYLSTFVQDVNGFAEYYPDRMVCTDENGELSEQYDLPEARDVKNYAAEFLEKAASLYPQITYELFPDQDMNDICVHLNLEVSDRLVDQALEMAETIYEEGNLNEGWLNNVTFVLCDEKEEDRETARIYFGKQQNTGRTDYSVNVLFHGGRMDWYQEEMEEKLEESEFYRQRLNTMNGTAIGTKSGEQNKNADAS